MPISNRALSIAGIVCFLIFFFLFPLVRADEEPVTQPHVVRVGIYDNKPKIYRDDDGQVKGFFADILNYTAAQEGWKIDYIDGTWDEGLERLKNNEIDIMVDVALSEERQQVYDFNNETALFAWGVIYTRPGVKIEKINDLEGKNIAVMKSGILFTGPWGIENLLNSFQIKSNYTDVKVYGDVFKLLDQGEADAGVVNTFYGFANQKDYKVVRTNIVFNPSELRFALTKNAPANPYLIEKLDANLQKQKADNNSAYQKNMQAFLTEMEASQEVEVFPVWAQMTLIISGIGIAALLVIYFIALRYRVKLEKTVRARTAELKRSEEKYRTTIERANDGVAIIQDQIIKYGNAALASIRGEPLEKIIGQNFTKFVDKESLPKVVDFYKRRLRNEKIPTEYETVLRNVAGDKIYVEVNTGLADYEGRLADVVMVHDITERKKSEAKVKELNELRKKFVQIVSHQLRTPLTSIRWNTEALLSGDMGKMEPAQEQILRSTNRAEATVINRLGDLLTVMEIEEGRENLSKETASIESLWGSVIKDVKKKCQAKNLRFIYHSPDKLLPKVSIDLEKMRVVFWQLMSNALDYTRPGGKIETRFINRRGRIRFEVSDNGIGIPEVEQPRIFEKFFRASNAAAMETDRSGIGLSIAKFYIEEHGGKIGFSSEESKGSTFWFEIPASSGD